MSVIFLSGHNSEMELPDTATFNSGDGGKTSVQFMSDRIVVERNKCYRDGGDGVVAISEEIKIFTFASKNFTYVVAILVKLPSCLCQIPTSPDKNRQTTELTEHSCFKYTEPSPGADGTTCRGP